MEVIISDSGDEQEGMNITLILKCLVYSSMTMKIMVMKEMA